MLADVAIAAAPAWTGTNPPAEVEALVVDALDALGASDPSRRIKLLARLARSRTSRITTANAVSSTRRVPWPRPAASTAARSRCRGRPGTCV